MSRLGCGYNDSGPLSTGGRWLQISVTDMRGQGRNDTNSGKVRLRFKRGSGQRAPCSPSTVRRLTLKARSNLSSREKAIRNRSLSRISSY
jgi:hypothetical protein